MGQQIRTSFDVSAFIDEPETFTSPAIFRSSDNNHLFLNRERMAFVTKPRRPLTAGRQWSIRAHLLTRLCYPRGISWHEFPIVADPCYRPMLDAVDRGEGNLVRTIDGVRQTVRNMGRILYDEVGEAGDANYGRYRTGSLASLMFPDVPILARFVGDEDYRPRTASDLMERDRCRLRLEYSYTINFRAIAFKAMRHAIGDVSANPRYQFPAIGGIRHAGNVPEDWSVRGLSRMDRFEYLQFLYCVRHIPEVELFKGIRRGAREMHVPGRIEDGYWLGTGKHPPADLLVANIFQDFLAEAVGLGLIRYEKDSERASITETGLALLDLMHPDNEDPDAVCRWAGPIPSERLEGADAWLMRFFRKMKTRINRI